MNKIEGEKTGRRILRAPAVEDRTQRSRVQCWRDIKAGTFPLPVQLGPNSVGWFEDEIDGWLAARPRQMCSAPFPATHKCATPKPKPAAKKKTKPRHAKPKRKLAARPAAGRGRRGMVRPAEGSTHTFSGAASAAAADEVQSKDRTSS